MTSSSHDKNRGARMGFTDKDYIEALGLDPALEGKPEINQAIKKAIAAQTTRNFVQDGRMNETRAQKLANRVVK